MNLIPLCADSARCELHIERKLMKYVIATRTLVLASSVTALNVLQGNNFLAKETLAAAKDIETPSLGYSVDKAAGNAIVVDQAVYERVDDKIFKANKFKSLIKDHALHETLNGENMVEKYEIYRKKNEDEIMAVVRFGRSLNGHPRIVHGGITSLVFDNSFGWLFMCLNKPSAVTANLMINFRAPLKQNTTTILRAKMVREEGRKMFMEATLHEPSADGREEKIVADSNTLFVKMKLDWKKRIGLFLSNLVN